MIGKLHHKDADIAEKIRTVFQVSYAVEADLLKVDDFPPLKRTLDEFLKADTQFYGFWKDEALAGVVEIRTFENTTLIQSLVVDPKFFRKGIGKELVRFTLDTFPSPLIHVETGAANQPAILLYEKMGFEIIKEYRTEHGITKVRLEKKK
jgi:ribosomal protein S18 acetylase RimI-like enzyme